MKKRFAGPALGAMAFAVAAAAAPNYNQPLDRPYTLRNSEPLLLEREHGRMIFSGGPMSFIFPRPCLSQADSSRVCGEAGGFVYGDSARDRRLSFSPMAGYEYRYIGGNAQSAEFGALAAGNNGPLSFLVDARMFTEFHDDFSRAGYDREYVETQDAQAGGGVAYASYSRYRANLAYDLPWGRFTAGRDGAHWGPGLYNSLVFNREAVPFNQLTFTSRLGPVTVHGLYGQLAVEGDLVNDTTHRSRSVYAHRYEWNAARNLVLGISEQLIVYNHEEPFAFVPVVPLFIFKGDGYERLNNGGIAGDFCWRFPGLGLLYSEFLIDDIQSPTTLFDDQWGNKWAWMAGAQWARKAGAWELGGAAEYARIEPWVYTHYLPATAQAANLGFPLGNPSGPNSMSVDVSAFARAASGLSLSLRSRWLWKGRDAGSQLQDSPPKSLVTKEFLAGVSDPDFRLAPGIAYAWRKVSFAAEGNLGPDVEAVISLRYWY